MLERLHSRSSLKDAVDNRPSVILERVTRNMLDERVHAAVKAPIVYLEAFVGSHEHRRLARRERNVVRKIGSVALCPRLARYAPRALGR